MEHEKYNINHNVVLLYSIEHFVVHCPLNVKNALIVCCNGVESCYNKYQIPILFM